MQDLTLVACSRCLLVGLESVTNPANLMRFAPGDVVTLLGKVHPMPRIGQIAVHQQFVSGKIRRPM